MKLKILPKLNELADEDLFKDIRFGVRKLPERKEPPEVEKPPEPAISSIKAIAARRLRNWPNGDSN